MGADPKWIHNAAAALGRDLSYTVGAARRLGLARRVQREMEVPLVKAWEVAARALRGEPSVSESGLAAIVVDVQRYLSDFAVRLSCARTHYEPARRGRPARPDRHSAVERARRYGIDIGLLRSSLRMTPAARLKRLEADRTFVTAFQNRRRR